MSQNHSEQTVSVQINGRWMEFPKGTRMIEALRQAEEEVPHYCYHPKLSSPGNCRMCLVEMGMPGRPRPGEVPAQKDVDGKLPIQWSPRPVISCANVVADNMGIRTQSLLVEESRKGVMEFLLLNHPLDCPICDQAGECRLQEFSVEHGQAESRSEEQKVKKPKRQKIGARITLDDERCIMCSRCIRFMDEIVDDPVLGFTDRGSHTTLTVHPDRPLDNAYSLNTVDICPVGALTNTDFRFQMRTWFLKETESVCHGCARGCNMTIASRNNKIYRQTPRENNDVNSSWMCDHGRLGFHYLQSEKRLTQPLIKNSDDIFSPSTWEEAMEKILQSLKKYPADQIALIASARLMNEELYLLKKIATTLGIPHIDSVPRTQAADDYLISADKNPNTNGVKTLLLAQQEPGKQLASIRQKIESGEIKALISWGENLLKDAAFTEEELNQVDFHLHAHLLENPTAQKADVCLPIAGYAEKSGTMINATGRLQKYNPAVSPPGKARVDAEILHDLYKKIDPKAPTESHWSALFEQMKKETPALSSVTEISPQGLALLETEETIPLLEREQERLKKGEIVG